MDVFLLIAAGAFAGGFVSGLAGFGTGITSMGLWLYAVPPTVAATLVIVCSLAAQLQTLGAIRHAIDWRLTGRFVVPGLVGIPFGIALLSFVDASTFKVAIGGLLVVYAAHALLMRGTQARAWRSRLADGAVGFIGGVMGGLAGLSGPIPTMWSANLGLSKDERRALLQTFNLSMLVVAFAGHIGVGLVTRELMMAALAALPFTFIGAWLGRVVYGQVSDDGFRTLIIVLLGLSGLVLLATNLTI